MATTPTAPRACLLSIPPELKAHIVQLAAWQDDVAADRRNSDRDLPSSPVGSLVALSLVNKEFNDLTAVHLFETINPSRFTRAVKKAKTRTVAFLIPHHSHNIHQLTLDSGATWEALEAVLASPLASLHRLSITLEATQSVLVDDIELTAEGHHSEEHGSRATRAALLAFGSRIDDLTLVDLSNSLATSVIPFFPFLRHLHFPTYITFAEDNSSLSRFLAMCALLSLEMCMPSCEDSDGEFLTYFLPKEWVTDDWNSVGTLRDLKLVTHELDHTDWGFVERVSETLEVLELDFTSFDQGEYEGIDVPVFNVEVWFPHLRKLVLRNLSEGEATLLLSHLSSSPLSSLDLSIYEIDLLHLEESSPSLSLSSPSPRHYDTSPSNP